MFSEYVGIPFKEGGRDRNGIDCYGLPRLIYKELKNIELYDSDKEKLDGEYFLKYHHLIYRPWISVSALEMKPFDLIVFDVWNDSLPSHTGIYIGNNKFIHSMRNLGVVISKLDKQWSNKIFNVWRHEELVN